MSRIAIAGSFIRDRIIPLNGSEFECIGGLYHSVAFAALLAGENSTIYPIACVGKDFWRELTGSLSVFPAIRLDALIPDPQENTQVLLTYLSKTERDEVTTKTMRPILFDELETGIESDALLVNLISGDDLELHALKKFRQCSSAMVYLDLHSRMLGIDKNGKRFLRELSDWQDWFAQADFIQLNETEAGLLMGESEPSNLDYQQFIKRILEETNVRGINITLGERGVLAGMRFDDEKSQIKHFGPTVDKSSVQDVIGCGDAFGAAFVVSFLQSPVFFDAVAFANKIAGLNATTMGSITKEKFNRMAENNAIA